MGGSTKGPTDLKSTGVAGSIGGLISKSVPALKPEHRAFVVVSGALTMLLLGIVFVSADTTIAKWATLGVLVIVALDSLLVFLLVRGSAHTDDYTRRRLAADSVNGKWWQLVLVKGADGRTWAEGVTIVNFRLHVQTGSYGLGGDLFDRHGRFRAHWQADAVAIQQLAPVELFYRFSGTSHRRALPDRHTGSVTGIGVFTFEGTDSRKHPALGSGWFSTGDVERLEFDPRCDVYLVRASKEEEAILAKDPRAGESAAREELVAKRFDELANRYGAVVRSRED